MPGSVSARLNIAMYTRHSPRQHAARCPPSKSAAGSGRAGREPARPSTGGHASRWPARGSPRPCAFKGTLIDSLAFPCVRDKFHGREQHVLLRSLGHSKIGPNMRTLVVPITLLLVSGCAPMVWNKPGASQDDFSRDRYTCMQDSQQRVSGAVVNQFGGYSTNEVITNPNIFRACMNANGWYLQQQNQVQPQTASVPPLVQSARAARVEKTNEEKLRELNAQVVAEAKAMCQRQEYEVITAKSACATGDMKPEQLADTSKLREADKVAFLKMRGEMEARERRLISGTQIWGQTVSVPWSNAMERAAASSADNARALYGGRVTWGEFNRRRVEISKTYRDEYTKIMASK